MSVRRMLPFIFINIIVSTVVVLVVLSWWDNRQEEITDVTRLPAVNENGTPVAVAPTAAPSEGQTEEEATLAPDGEEEGPTIHIVQVGDTLGRISAQYDVPIADIAEVNGIVNVNAISVGQELIIPVGGVPTPTLEATATEVAAESPPTPRPTEPLPDGTAVIEISEVIGVGDLATEAVRISNAGSRPINLRDWQLRDEDGRLFTFVDVTLFGSSDAGSPSILVHTETGQNGPSDLYWGEEVAIWSSGETVTLQDSEGTEQATYIIP